MECRQVQNKLKFLWQAAHTFSATSYLGSILKSHYLTLCRRIPRLENKTIEVYFGERSMCKKCSSSWIDGNFKTKIIPQKLPKSKGKKLIAAYKSGKELTKTQKKRAKWFMKNSQSYFQISCNLCKHINKIALKKPIKIKKQLETEISNVESNSLVKIKKKSNKKKDKFAGLNKKAIKTHLQTKEKITACNTSNKSVKTSEILDDSNPTKQKKLQQESIKIKKNTADNIKFKGKAKFNINNNKNISSSKKSNKSTKSAHQQQQVKSKTQQKNALLQLAQVLKKSESNQNNKNNSVNDRLKNLLK